MDGGAGTTHTRTHTLGGGGGGEQQSLWKIIIKIVNKIGRSEKDELLGSGKLECVPSRHPA